MSEKPINPLRQRMIEDVMVRKVGAATQRNYIHRQDPFGVSRPLSGDRDGGGPVRRFQVQQSGTGAQPPVMNSTVSALRSFFRVTLDVCRRSPT